MNKKCLKCGSELPDGASFCLHCFTDVAERKIQAPPVTFVATTKSKKRYIRYVAAVIGCLFALCLLALILKSCVSNSGTPVEETVIVTVTETVPVTNTSGEAVTDASGQQIFDVVQVTKAVTVSTTKKKGLLDKITSAKATEKPDSNTTTTKKQSFFDKLFGTDEEETTKESTTSEKTTTEKTTQKPTSTTSEKTTEKTTEKPTESSTQSNTATPVGDFEYTLSEKYASIKKYTGNASHVTIPAVIESRYVTEVCSNAFKDNSTVKTVTFADNSKRPYLWVRNQLFNNCKNLKTINLPDTDLGIMNNFATGCTSLEKLTLKNDQYRYVDGSLYYYSGSGWKLRFHCPAHPTTSITLPEYSDGIEGAANLEEALNVKNIYVNEYATDFPDSGQLPKNCENVFVDDKNAKGYDVNGIAFQKNNNQWMCIYPPANKTKSLTLPDNTLFFGQDIENPYLETLYIPKNADIWSIDNILYKRAFSNLKNLYIHSEHSDVEYVIKNSNVTNTKKY